MHMQSPQRSSTWAALVCAELLKAGQIDPHTWLGLAALHDSKTYPPILHTAAGYTAPKAEEIASSSTFGFGFQVADTAQHQTSTPLESNAAVPAATKVDEANLSQKDRKKQKKEQKKQQQQPE